MTDRNGELGGEVGVAFTGEDGGVGRWEWSGGSGGGGGPEGEGGVTVRSGAEDGVDVLHEVVDVVEEAAAVNLVDEARCDHFVVVLEKHNKEESKFKSGGFKFIQCELIKVKTSLLA